MTKIIKYLKCFLYAQRGAVAIEAAFYFLIFAILCTLLMDFSTIFLNKSYLERVNNSLALVLRERNAFYQHRESLEQQDVDKLYKIAGVLFKDSRLAGASYGIAVDGIFFQPGDEKIVKETQSFTSGSVSCHSQSAINSDAVQRLSPWDKDGKRWMPVYQITICLPEGTSAFQRAIGNMGVPLGNLVISNAVIPR
ncbi:tight adherence pilus pseudopilin TadF [Enterobacteriaceae bacterium ESL0689]|nr:tight adherence pilus pseudopilin TadF [Enterobacteriaceae bacterium ESL0689]